VETHLTGETIYTAVIQRLLYCAALLPVLAFGQDAQPPVIDLPTLQKADDLWEPILPPTSTDGADVLDRRVYSQFNNDELRLENEPGSSKSYSFVPHAALVSYYDDNVNLSRTNQQRDFAVAAEPGAAFGLGDFRAGQNNFLTLDYTGRLTAYLNNSSSDSYEQFATLHAQLVFAKWRFNTNFRLLDLTGGNIDSGNSGWHRNYDTEQVATYELSEKDFLELQGENVVRDYQTGPGSVEWQGRALYNYRLDPKLTFGGGVAGGVLNVQNSGSQTYEQALVRAFYDPSEKLSFQGLGGLEMRQLPSGEDRFIPVLDLTCDYLPRLGTKVELTGYSKTYSSSDYGDQDYTATGVGLSVSQELGVSWLVSLRGGYENNSYFYTNMRAPSPRQDNVFYVNPSVQFRINDYSKIELFYNYRQNDSNNYSRAFTDNQVGIRASFTY
jgi:hypothetical protein